MWTSTDYRSAHAAYDWRGGVKACALYAFTMLALFVQGRLYLSSLSTAILASLNIVRPLVALVATLVVVFAARERVASIASRAGVLAKAWRSVWRWGVCCRWRWV